MLSPRIYLAATLPLIAMSNIVSQQAAKADEVIIERGAPVIKTVIVPAVTRSVVVYPTATTTTTVAPVMPIASSTVTRTVRKEIVSHPETSIVELGKAPNFQTRLALLKEQILSGLSKGWITSSQADIFLSQEEKLAEQDRNMRLNGYTIADVDALERQLNTLNIAVSDNLSHGTRTAGLSIPNM